MTGGTILISSQLCLDKTKKAETVDAIVYRQDKQRITSFFKENLA